MPKLTTLRCSPTTKPRQADNTVSEALLQSHFSVLNFIFEIFWKHCDTVKGTLTRRWEKQRRASLLNWAMLPRSTLTHTPERQGDRTSLTLCEPSPRHSYPESMSEKEVIRVARAESPSHTLMTDASQTLLMKLRVRQRQVLLQTLTTEIKISPSHLRSPGVFPGKSKMLGVRSKVTGPDFLVAFLAM